MKLPQEHEHFIDFEKIKREAFILLNLGYGCLALREDNEGDVNYRKEADLFQDFGSLYCEQVSSLLISISILGRILDDKVKNSGCGVLASKWEFEDMLGDDTDGNHLSLRGCFNKVIHAEGIDHELMQLPEVYLNGKTQSNKEWNVRIFILPFCTSVFQWANENKNLVREKRSIQML